ncbi:MAG: pectinesterase family protein [Prevotella sp.]
MNYKMTNIHCRQILRTVIVLLLLLVGSIQNTWADEVIFSMSTNVSSTETVSNGGTIDGSTFANVTGGTVTYQNNNNSNAYEAVKDSKFYLGTSSCYFKIELSKALKTGDKIRFASMPASSNGLTGISISSKSSDEKKYNTTTNVFADVEYEVPEGLNGVSTIYLFRIQSKGTSFNDMTIVRPTQTIELSSSPSVSLTANTTYYIDVDGKYQTEEPESYVATYSCTGNNSHGNIGTKITIPNATEGKYTVVLGGCKYNNGAYTISSNNEAFETITISQVESKTSACYPNEGGTIAAKSFVVTTPTTITIKGGSYTYLPYFSVVQSIGSEVKIVYSPEGSGTVDVDGNLYKNGETVTMKASPSHGYVFKEWRDAEGNSFVSTENPYTFTMGTEDVTYTAVFEALPLFELTTTVEPVGGGTITNKDTYSSHPEGEQITLTAVPATGYSFNGWKKNGSTVSTELTYSFNMLAEPVAITAVFDKQYSITFGVGETGALGQVPPVIYVQADNATSFTVPNNNSLYKKGYTLTAWTDGTNTYKIGENPIATSNLTLTPVFTPNSVSLSDLTEETTVTWQFGKSKGAPSLNINTNSTLYLVTQAEVNGILIDVPFYIQTKTGKFANSSRSDEFAQVNSGSVYTIPAFKDAMVKIGGYFNETPSDTKVGSTLVTGPEGSAKPYYYSASVSEADITDGNVAITIGTDMKSYLSSVSITYPAQKRLSDLKIALEKENITLNLDKSYTLTLDTDYYTSSTGIITYESSIPSVAEVDENGVITPKGYGKTIVTLNQEGDANYASGSIAFTVKVISPEGQTLKPEAEITEDGTVTFTATEGAKIYYTTDGSLPNESSTEYTAPISAQGQVVKAMAISGTKSPSDIVTAYVNVEGTFTWNWNTSGTLQTVPVIAGNVKDIVDENTKAVIGKKLTQSFYDKEPVKAVTVQPTDGIAVSEPDEESTISFNIIPVAGVSFKPTDVSFKAASLTSSGLMDVYLKSENNSYPLVMNKYALRDNKELFNNDVFKAIAGMTDISTIPAAAEEWSLKTYIYTLTKDKQWAFSDIVISGKFTGVEYDGVFFNISTSAEPAEGGVVYHSPSALKAQAGKHVTFIASPNTGYKFVKWRDYDKNEDVSTSPITDINSLNSNVSYEAVFEKLPKVSFENNVTDLDGEVPSAMYVNADGTFKIPENNTLYKEGYALTAWTDGTREYLVGQTYTFTSDITLKPVMSKCDKALTDTDVPVTAKWYFDQKDGAPVISWTTSSTVFTYTKCITVNGSKVDLPMVMTGAKADNNDARVNFLKDTDGNEARGGQLNKDLTLKIPAVYGMVVRVKASGKADYESDPTTPSVTKFQNATNNTELSFWYDNAEGTQSNAVGEKEILNDYLLQYTYQDNASAIYVKVDYAGSAAKRSYGFFDYIEVVYPQLPEVKVTNSITSDSITTWEKVENAGATEMTQPDKNGNTGKRYKEGDNVTITATAGYGYYISAFKDGETTLPMTKVEPNETTERPTKATTVYTVGEKTANITVEYTRLPMAKVRLETVDSKLGHVDFLTPDIHENFYEKGDGYVESYFVANDKVQGTADAADDYVLLKWVDIAEEDSVANGATFSIDVPAEGNTVTYQAHFTPGKMGSVYFDETRPMMTEDGGETFQLFTIDSKSTWPADQINCRSFYIPKYHGLFKSYDLSKNEKGWTLMYWIDESNNKYEIGKNYSFATEGQTITLRPVFVENITSVQNIVNDPLLTYEFGTGIGIRAQKLDLPKRDSTYLCAPVYTEVLENGTKYSYSRDVALEISTGAKGFVRNEDFDAWASIGPGTTLTIPSCAGATIELLSYAPISTTTIDGEVPTEYEKTGEHEYVYRYTTQNPASRIKVVIGDDFSYYKWIKSHMLAANRVQLHTTVENTDQGAINKTDVVVSDNDKDYIQKLEDGGYSLIQGTRVKVSFERKFGYVFDKIVDPDKIVDGEPFTVLQMLDNDTVSMVKPDDAKEVEYLVKNEDGTWGSKDKEFILRVKEPTDEEKRNGQRTRYEVEFEITKHRNLQFYFKEKPTYYITFNPGKLATGIAPTAKWVEADDEYTIPNNSTLYYSGYTLKRWKSEDGNYTYDIGNTYKAPAYNLRLFPEFDKNTFSLLDENLTKESTATWHLTRNDGAPDLAYERSSGILVTQLKKDPDDALSDFIDLRIDMNASDREIGEGDSKVTVHGKFNNMNYDDRCQINMYSILSFPVTKGCEIALEATSTISSTSIAGATADNGGYTAGNNVTTTWNGAEGTQDVNFQSDGRYYTYFAVTYKPQTIAKPALQSVSVSGTPLTAEQLDSLTNDYSINLNTYPVKLDPETGKFVEEKMDTVVATASGSGKVYVTQPTIDNPKAEIRLLSAGNILLETYNINFNLKATEPDVEGAEKTPQFLYTEINGTQYKTTNVTVENMPASGYIKVVFDRTMQSVSLPFTDAENNLNETFTAEQGKELIFYYWNIPNAELNYVLPGSMFKDIYGKEFAGSFEKHFKTRSTTKELYQKTFDFIVGEDGTLDDAINAANANEGTDRYLIFVPDGEYQLTGNEPLDSYGITSDGEWPRDENGDERTDMLGKNNGRTVVSRPKVSIIGQSREGVKIYNHPIVEGISYTATIHVGGKKIYNDQGELIGTKRAEDFYAEDISLENQFDYWNSMNGGSGAGRAVVLWDQGQRTVMKNVSMMSWQDTYYSSNATSDYRGYFENCAIGGVVDWLCGDGNIWLEKCDIVVRDRSGNNLAAPSQEAEQQWGYVFMDCNIVPEFPLSQMEKLKDKTWTLARPWANSPTKSPACTFINTKMSVLPKDQGWGSMGSGAILRFHENHTMDGDGTVISLGARSLAACAPAAGSDDCVMNDTEASKYTIENVLGGSDSFTPKERTMQIDAKSGGKEAYDKCNSVEWDDQIETDDDRLQWQAHPNALCYFVFKMENDEWCYKANLTETSISLDQLSLGSGTYCVRAANQYGGLGAPTKPITYQEMKRYTLTIKQLGNLTVDGVPYGWSTICLPYNAKTPENVKVYAATAHNKTTDTELIDDYYMTLTPVDYLTKEKGYVVYGPAGEYVFKGTSHNDNVPTILDGNATDSPISSVNHNCYVLANKTYGLGFYKYTGSTLSPYRAWLPAEMVESDINISLSSGTKGIRFVFDEEDIPTSLRGILYGTMEMTGDDRLYNISGQQVSQPGPAGIYISRGKGKVVHK